MIYNRYYGKDMKEAHKNLNITDTHYNAIKEHMAAALKENGVHKDLIMELDAILENLKIDIVKSKIPLYEKIGGEAAVILATEKFYDKVLADNRINHFFKGVNMERLRK
jgi:truncated hemoglobin YjbI